MRKQACCMCPAISTNFKTDVCDNCDFVNRFEDARGWQFFVRSGMGSDSFNTFYVKAGTKKQRSCSMTQFRDSFAQAQEDLNKLAEERGWKVVPKDANHG